MSVAIFGDSYVTRLAMYARGDKIFDKYCKFYGVSGMSTRNKFDGMFKRLCDDCPRYAFIHLGGNSITSTCTPADIVSDLLGIVNELKQRGVERVFVATIVERGKIPACTGMDTVAFNRVRKAVNKKLKTKLREDVVDIGKRLRFPRHYDRDLVNPGEKEGGLNVFKHTVRKVVHKYCT